MAAVVQDSYYGVDDFLDEMDVDSKKPDADPKTPDLLPPPLEPHEERLRVNEVDDRRANTSLVRVVPAFIGGGHYTQPRFSPKGAQWGPPFLIVRSVDNARVTPDLYQSFAANLRAILQSENTRRLCLMCAPYTNETKLDTFFTRSLEDIEIVCNPHTVYRFTVDDYDRFLRLSPRLKRVSFNSSWSRRGDIMEAFLSAIESKRFNAAGLIQTDARFYGHLAMSSVDITGVLATNGKWEQRIKNDAALARISSYNIIRVLENWDVEKHDLCDAYVNELLKRENIADGIDSGPVGQSLVQEFGNQNEPYEFHDDLDNYFMNGFVERFVRKLPRLVVKCAAFSKTKPLSACGAFMAYIRRRIRHCADMCRSRAAEIAMRGVCAISLLAIADSRWGWCDGWKYGPAAVPSKDYYAESILSVAMALLEYSNAGDALDMLTASLVGIVKQHMMDSPIMDIDSTLCVVAKMESLMRVAFDGLDDSDVVLQKCGSLVAKVVDDLDRRVGVVRTWEPLPVKTPLSQLDGLCKRVDSVADMLLDSQRREALNDVYEYKRDTFDPYYKSIAPPLRSSLDRRGIEDAIKYTTAYRSLRDDIRGDLIERLEELYNRISALHALY